ncbi:hypothetical protein J2T17_004459 [Paenibacillus mucilaginosus]|uniref:hypothetical protein n=1 Tax=Paenibacillus mucilaginosus TaxID=61624 RepID=UPI003D1DFAEC
MPGFYWRLKDFLTDENRQPNNIIAGRDGKVYEIRDNALGRLVLHKPFLPMLDEIRPGFEYALPKIPGELLTRAISFFRSYCTRDAQNEVMLQIFFNTLTGQYDLECPVQKVRWDSIKADCSQRFDDLYFIQVMQLHSHNTMPAYFSAIDNADEQKYMLYGVVGDLLNETPEMKLRVGHGGQWIMLPIEHIFDRPDLRAMGPFPAEWHNRVTVDTSADDLEMWSTISPIPKQKHGGLLKR